MNTTETSIDLRRATPGDAPAIAEVHVAAWREAYLGLVPAALLTRETVEARTRTWREALTDNDLTAFVAGSPREEIAGFGACGRQHAADVTAAGYPGEIVAIYVRRTAQRSGIGRALMARMARHMAGLGYSGAAVWVLASNVPARTFYEQLGARIVCERQDRWDETTTLTEIAYGWPNLFALAAL